MAGLNHYTKNGNSPFFSYEDHEVDRFWDSISGNLAFTAQGTTASQEYIGSTDPQSGIFRGAEMLRNASIPEGSLPRVPVIILLTDGEPNESTDNYKTGSRNDGSATATNVNNNIEDYYYTIATAAYQKDQITAAYQQKQPSSSFAAAKFYTIGLGLSENTVYEIMLNPARRGAISGENYSNIERLKNAINSNSAEKMGFSSYDYADDAYIGAMTSEDLQDVFNTIVGELSQVTAPPSIGEDTGVRNKINFYETLTGGMQFTDQMSLTVPTYTIEEDEIVKGADRTYTLSLYAANTAGGLAEGTRITSENGPAYITAGGIVTAQAEMVRIGNGAEQALDESNLYDQAAKDELSLTIRQLSSGQRQLQASIPAQLMAYNLLHTVDGTTNYITFEPVELKYQIKLRPDAEEGAHLMSYPTQSYVEFFPSSDKFADGEYLMPYYWVNNSFETDNKLGGGVEGASPYIRTTEKGTNNNVRIYLGNNGLIKLEGKDLTMHFIWDDADNQDGKRPSEINVELYKQVVDSVDAGAPAQAPAGTEITKVGSYTLNAANRISDETVSDIWELKLSGEPVYDDNGYLRYWLKVSAVNAYTDETSSEANHNSGIKVEDTDENANWYCLWSITGGDLLTDSRADVSLKHTPEDITYTITKNWSGIDTSAQPDTVEIYLYANGQRVDEQGSISASAAPITISKADSWSKTLTLPKYKNGTEIQYTVVEAGDDYTWTTAYTAQGVTLTNYPSQDKMTVTAQKSWEDADNQDGIRPESVELKLTAEVNDADYTDDLGEIQLTKTANEANNWIVSWENLPKTNAENTPITYSVVEPNVPEGYTVTVDPSAGNPTGYFFVVNSHTPETTDITINKTWADNDNQDGNRPTAVSGGLYKQVGDGGITAVSSFTIGSTNSVTLSDLPKFEGGQAITYYVSENVPEGYTLTVTGENETAADGVTVYPVNDGTITLTNSYTPKVTAYTVNLIWDDNNNRDGARPASVSGMLGGESITITGDSYQKEGLPVYNNGALIHYQATITAPAGYTATIQSFGQYEITYKLTYTEQAQTLGFTKVWAGDSDDNRPSADEYGRYLTLQQDGNDSYVGSRNVTDNKDGTYTVTYSGLPKWNGDQQYTYTVKESTIPNYTADNGGVVTLTADNTNTLTNTYSAEVYSTITVTKEWVGDADGNRPEADIANDPLQIGLYSGSDAGAYADSIKPNSVEVSGDTWTYTWRDVAKTDDSGNYLSYSAHEYADLADYTKTVATVAIANGTANGKLINTMTDSGAVTADLTITKAWSGDEQYQDARPESIQVRIAGSYEGGQNQISREVELTADGGWTVTAENLPISQNGKTISYTVTEINPPAGYTPSVAYGDGGESITLVNENAVTVTNTYSPDTFRLYYDANGGTGAVPVDDTNYTSANNTATILAKGELSYSGATFLGWSKTTSGLITSEDMRPQEVYTAGQTLTLNSTATLYAVWAIDANGDGVPDYDQKFVTVNIIWNDDSNRCGIRPNEVGFTLDGEDYEVNLNDPTGVLITTEGENTKWIYQVPDAFAINKTFAQNDLTGVNVTAKAHADSTDTAGYTDEVAVAGDEFTITLTHTPETTEHKVTKTWNFGEAAFTTGEATIVLLGNGIEVTADADGDEIEPITFAPNGDKDLTWTNLPKYEGGKKIVYHAIETQVLDNNGNDVTAHFKTDYIWDDENGTTAITNTYTALRNVTLIYTWDDNDDEAGLRPESVDVALYAGIDEDSMEQVADSEQIISADNDWSTVWEDLAVFAEDNAARLAPTLLYEARVVGYTDSKGNYHNVQLEAGDNELGESGYSFAVAAFGTDSVFLLNSALDNQMSVDITKAWSDEDNKFNKRPERVWVNILQNGVVYRSAELTEDNEWKAAVSGLPIYADDGEYDYGVSELSVAGYTSSCSGDSKSGFTVTNTLGNLGTIPVTYVYNNGNSPKTVDVPYGDTAAEEQPAWTGHFFKGWYTDNNTFLDEYNFALPVTQPLTLYAKWHSTHNGGEDEGDFHYITFVYENAGAKDEEGTDIKENSQIKVPCLSNYKFTAQAASSSYILSAPTYTGDATLISNNDNSYTLTDICGDITVTIKATRRTTGGGGGGGGGGGTGGGTTAAATSKPTLEKGDHFAYVVGYPDGLVRPENNITRAEVAAIFYRLLTDESREEYYTPFNPFPDVQPDDWYGDAVATLANADILGGYPDGTFKPNAPITRAELATIASRFDDISGGSCKLSDIKGHWAEELIISAYNKGWVGGYPDGTFRPDQYITRAEVMTLINRVLDRLVDIDGMLPDMIVWKDNLVSDWFYEDVQEATNSHDYSRDDEKEVEQWIKINSVLVP